MDYYLIHIDIGGRLDPEYNRAGDRIRRHRELVSGGGELGFHNQVLGSQFSLNQRSRLRRVSFQSSRKQVLRFAQDDKSNK
jgi:hypothetical protein